MVEKPQFSEKFQGLLEAIDNALRAAVQSEEITSREHAIHVKKIISLPLGVLNQKHKLAHNSATRHHLELRKMRR